MSTRTEQEQIEAFTQWWNANGTFIIAAVVVALSAYFGWTAWQKHQQTQAVESSAIFQKILDGKADANVAELVGQLKKDYPNTYYGQAVHLLLAEEAVRKGQLDLAEQELTTLLDKKPDAVLAFTARLRLARVLFAEGKYDPALAQLGGDVSEAYTSLYAELKGDILAAQAQTGRAAEAYSAAIRSLPEGHGDQKRTLEMKLNNLATVSAPVTMPAVTSETVAE